MIGRTNASSSSVYAFIVASYPAGAICTCGNGTKTITAKDTSGTFVFEIPSAGSWTVTATIGGSTLSTTKVISYKGQSELVTLASDLWLFKGTAGEGNVGNLTKNGYSYTASSGYAVYAPTITSSVLQLTTVISNTSAVIAGTPSAIDLTPYNSLYLKYYTANGQGSNARLNVHASDTAALTTDTSIIQTTSPSTSSYEEKTFDISAVDGTKFLAFVTINGRAAYIKDIKLSSDVVTA